MPKRLDFILSNAGGASRSEVKTLIRRGHVCVDGEIIKDPSAQFDENVQITVDGKPIDTTATVYCIINKPAGYVCSNDGDDSVLKLIKPPLYRKDIFTVGRLDKDTTGLLIITNDGTFAHSVTAPRRKIEKTYRATLSRPVTEDDIERFAEGIEPFAPAKLEKDGENAAFVTVTEGQFHEVKRLFAATGNEVLTLRRVSIGRLTLPDDLLEGDARALTDEEKDSIFV